MRREHRVSEALAGRRLDQALAELEPEESRRAIKRAIERGRVFVDGRRVKVASLVLKAGARIVLHSEPSAATPEVPVLYEDDDLLVVNKPPGLHVNETESTARTSVEAALSPTHGRLYVVHRLDLETSGVLVLAKKLLVAQRLGQAFADRQVEKLYLAITTRSVPEGLVDLPVGPDPRSPRTRRVMANGKPARTWFRALGARGGLHLVLARPETGRTHQIRVHAAELGAPIFGDRAYGGALAVRHEGVVQEAPRTLLHAWRLTLPGLGRGLRYEAPLPQDFQPFGESDLAVWAEAR